MNLNCAEKSQLEFGRIYDSTRYRPTDQREFRHRPRTMGTILSVECDQWWIYQMEVSSANFTKIPVKI